MMNDVSIKMTALCHRDVWCVTVAQKFMKRETKKVFFNEWISKFWNCILKPLFFWCFEIKKSWNGNGKAFKSDPLRKFNFGVMHFFWLHCYATTASILEYEHFLMHSTSWFLAHTCTRGNMIYSTLVFFGSLFVVQYYHCCQWAFANITAYTKVSDTHILYSTFLWNKALCLPISILCISSITILP